MWFIHSQESQHAAGRPRWPARRGGLWGQAGGGRQRGRWQRRARILFTTDGSSWGEKMEAASVTLVWKVNTLCCSPLRSFQPETGAGATVEGGCVCVCVCAHNVKHYLDLLTPVSRAEIQLSFPLFSTVFAAPRSLGRRRGDSCPSLMEQQRRTHRLNAEPS